MMSKIVRWIHFPATVVVWVILMLHGFSWWAAALFILALEVSLLGLFRTRWDDE